MIIDALASVCYVSDFAFFCPSPVVSPFPLFRPLQLLVRPYNDKNDNNDNGGSFSFIFC